MFSLLWISVPKWPKQLIHVLIFNPKLPCNEITMQLFMNKIPNLTNKVYNICSLLLVILSPLAWVLRVHSTVFKNSLITTLRITGWNSLVLTDKVTFRQLFLINKKQKVTYLWIPKEPRMGWSYTKVRLYNIKGGRYSTQMWRWVCAGTATYHLRTSGGV